MSKFKLLLLTNELAPGGVQRLVVNFANELEKKDVDVTVATLRTEQKYSFFKDLLKPSVVYIDFGFRGFWDVPGFFRLYRYIRREKFDVVFTQLFMSDLFGRLAALLARTRLIVTAVQNLIPSLPKKYIWTDWVLSKCTDACLSQTQAISVYARDVIGFPQKKIHEISMNAVDLSKFTTPIDRVKIRREIGIPEGAHFVLTVGRLIEQKGHTYLLRAMPLVLKDKPDTYFAIAGIGGLEASLKQEAKELGIEHRVIFLGARKDVPDLMRSADIFVFPSVWEGQGMVLAEAFFSDLPIVASNVGGIPDVIKHEETGLLAEPRDVEGLARALVRALSDDALMARLAREARVRYGDRTIENSAAALARLFSQLLDHKRSRR